MTMGEASDDGRDPRGRGLVEGVARVVAVEDGQVWLEPEPAAGCGGCPSAGSCDPTRWFKLAPPSRRFAVPDSFGGRVGERVVIGIGESSLVRASFAAYVVPMLTMIGAAMAVKVMGYGDGMAALAAAAGLGAGLLVTWALAGRLAARGELTPRYLRRAMGAPEAGGCELARHG